MAEIAVFWPYLALCRRGLARCAAYGEGVPIQRGDLAENPFMLTIIFFGAALSGVKHVRAR